MQPQSFRKPRYEQHTSSTPNLCTTSLSTALSKQTEATLSLLVHTTPHVYTLHTTDRPANRFLPAGHCPAAIRPRCDRPSSDLTDVIQLTRHASAQRRHPPPLGSTPAGLASPRQLQYYTCPPRAAAGTSGQPAAPSTLTPRVPMPPAPPRYVRRRHTSHTFELPRHVRSPSCPPNAQLSPAPGRGLPLGPHTGAWHEAELRHAAELPHPAATRPRPVSPRGPARTHTPAPARPTAGRPLPALPREEEPRRAARPRPAAPRRAAAVVPVRRAEPPAPPRLTPPEAPHGEGGRGVAARGGAAGCACPRRGGGGRYGRDGRGAGEGRWMDFGPRAVPGPAFRGFNCRVQSKQRRGLS